jgi:hypothetical protein
VPAAAAGVVGVGVGEDRPVGGLPGVDVEIARRAVQAAVGELEEAGRVHRFIIRAAAGARFRASRGRRSGRPPRLVPDGLVRL